jgi:nucleoside-diphosphate-sugar epimerase
MSRILVTGASGFIGRPVVDALIKDGHTVRAAVRRPQLSFPAGVEVVQHGDLAQPIDWRPLLAGTQQVIHLAGIAHIGRGVAAELYDRVNHRATAQLATTAAQAGISRLIFVSSIRAQTGPAADHALTERDPPAPTDAYGRSKLAAEQAVRSSGVPFTVLRPVLLYGPGVKGNFAMLARAAASPLPLPVKNFVNRRSILDIDNFISALQFVLSAPQTAGETYVVSDPGMALRLDDVIATLRQATDRRPFVMSMSTDYLEWPLRLIRRGDAWDRIGGNLRVDPGKLIGAGWHPLHDTRAGLTAMAQAAAPRKSGTASVSTR